MKELIAIYHPYFLLTAAAVNLSILLLVIFSGVRNIAAYGFVHCTIGIFGYLFLYALMCLTNNVRLQIIFTHIGQALINQISPGFYIFCVYFLDLPKQKRWALSSPLVGIIIIILLLSLPGQTIRHYWWGNFNVYPLPEAFLRLSFYYSMFFGFMVLSFWNFWEAFKREHEPVQRMQIKLIFIAFVVAYLGSWDHFPIMGIDLYPIGYIPLTIFSLIVFYTIVRYRFLDISLGFKRLSLVGVIYLVLFILSAPIIIPIAKTLSTAPWQTSYVGIIFLSIAAGLLFSLGPLVYAYLLRNSFWLRSHMTTGLTHELKSPLGAIQGAADIIRDYLMDPSINREKALEYIEMIRGNASRMESYVGDLLNVAKIQYESIALTKSKTDFVRLIKSTREEMHLLARAKSIEINYEGPFQLSVNADRQKISQVLSNLISNAIKFSNGGKILIRVTDEGHLVLCSVEDEGCGISEKHLSRIFERFYQVNPSQKGSGIGLAIAKAWVEAHGGKIWAESGVSGTKIQFTLPKY
jgi:signal transduction histidine kinase